ncbi:MAG: biotin/lipoyl-binding protein [Desulfosarcina sp.]|nr:biotin/lipoyl-binding protein [Desulfosarcina sp.]MBC2766623.1 biotin/lipoyl-binding protein [Desulfosarcina sp.]
MDSKKNSRQKKHVMIRIVICALILLVGWAGMNGLASLKQPPAEVKTEERAIKVQTMEAQPRDYPVAITGYGGAMALTVVTVAPEVSGRVVYTHPTLKAGQIIPVGDVMFRIDPADYEAGLQEAGAGVTQWQNSVARLKKQFAIDAQRLKTLERNAQLAKTEFERVKRLFEVDLPVADSGSRKQPDLGKGPPFAGRNETVPLHGQSTFRCPDQICFSGSRPICLAGAEHPNPGR